jgi:hypothetical protein
MRLLSRAGNKSRLTFGRNGNLEDEDYDEFSSSDLCLASTEVACRGTAPKGAKGLR